jgi:putative membrane protein
VGGSAITNATPGSATRTDGAAPGAVAGANSFTEGQARGRAEAAGYSEVGALARDNDGVWRGPAMRNGQRVQVGIDFQGNVTHR